MPPLVEFTSADDTKQPGGLGRPRPGTRNNISLLTSHGIAMDDWTSVGCGLFIPSLVYDLGFGSEKPLFRSLAGGMNPTNLNLSYQYAFLPLFALPFSGDLEQLRRF